MPFDFDAYLATKSAANDKIQAVIDASNSKVAELQGPDTPTAKATSAWADRLGLAPGSFTANRVNDAASLIAGASRVGGQVASLPVSLAGGAATDGLTEGDYAAYNRAKTGKATPADLELLNQRTVTGEHTVYDRLRMSEEQRGAARAINDAFDLTPIVNQQNRQGLQADLSKDFQPNWDKVKSGESGQVVSGIAGLLVNAGSALVKNPSAVREYILENLPQLFVGAAGKTGQALMTASNVGYAVDEFQKGMEAYAKANDGQLPSLERQQEMAMQAASLALAEQAGDVVGLRAAGALTGDAARTSFMSSMKNVLKAGAQGAASEAPTEGFQTYMEGKIEGKDKTAQEIYDAAVIGGASGAGLSGGGRTVAELARATPEHVAEQADAAQKQAAQDAAIQSGDVSAFTDPKSKDYAPAQAIAALHGHSQLDTTDDAGKQGNLQKADEILAGLEKERAVVAANQLDAAKRQAHIDDLKKQLAGETDPEFQTMLQEEIAAQEAEAAKPIDKAEAQKRRARLETLDTELAQARQNRDALGTLVTPQDVVENAVQALQDPAKAPEHQAAADKVITLAMSAPDRVDPKTAGDLAADTTNGLTSQQRSYLRQFSEARLAALKLMDMDKVSQAIYLGDRKKGDVGIAEYRSGITAALAAGDRKNAARQISALQRFAVAHTAKAEAAQAAMKQGLGSQIHRTKAGDWIVATPAQALWPKDLQKNGGLAIKSSALVSSIGTEAAAINAAAQEMRSAYAMKFTAAPKDAAPTTPGTGESDVPNTARQEGSDTQAEPQAPAAQDSTAAREGGKPSGPDAVSDAGTGTGDVQAAGVEQGAELVDQGKQPVAREAQNEGTSGSSVSTTEVDSQLKSSETSSGVLSGSSVENQSTSNTTAQPETNAGDQTLDDEVDPSSVEEVTPELQDPGKLGSLTGKSPEGTLFQSRKLGDFIEQSSGKTTDKTRRPLVAVKDFITELGSGSVDVATFLGFKPNEDQLKVITLFQGAAKNFGARIKQNLYQGDAKYFYKDWAQALVQNDGSQLDVEENVKTAISYAAFSWIAENAARTSVNDDDDEINAILGRDETHPVSDDERRVLGHVGQRQNLVVNALGRRITQALGMKAAKGAPANVLPDLQASLGAHAMKLLVDFRLIQRDVVDGEVMAQLTGREDTNTEASNFFVRVAEEGKGAARVEAILEASIGTGGVIDKLFGVEAGMKEPSLEPVAYEQKTTKNTDQKVPAKLAEAMARENANPFRVRGDMWALWQQLSEDALLEMAGAEELAGKHASNESNTKAKNDGLLREIQNFQRYVSKIFKDDEELKQPLYFDHTVWKQQRVGIATTVLNPQSSKVHRHMLTRESWSSEIDTTDKAQMNGFKLRVLEGLGVKTDKQTNAQALAGFTEKFNDTINAGVQVLVDMLEGQEITSAKESALVAAVAAGGENMHSLDALMAVAHWKLAEKRGQTKFTTELMGEVDGVTNGPMLSHLLMGAAASVQDLFGLLNRGGFFEQDNQFAQYNVWRSVAGHLDLYENTARHMTQAVQQYIEQGLHSDKGKMIFSPKRMESIMASVYAFSGELADKDGKVTKDGRNIIKTPLTAMVFGSSVPAAVNSMANKFVDAILAKIEDSAAGRSPASASEIIGHINNLLSIGSYRSEGDFVTAPGLREMDIERLMNYRFTADQVKGLKAAFTKTLGKAVSETMESDFGAYISQRKQFNDAAQLSFSLYEATYTAMRNQLMNELMDKGELPYYDVKESKDPRQIAVRAQYEATGFRAPLHDLTGEQERELNTRLRKVTPMLHSFMSKESGSLGAGLAISKTERKLSARTMYQGEVRFGQPFVDNGKDRARVKAFETTKSSPGVGMMPISIHSADSAISHLDIGDALNIHDAHGTGVGSAAAVAQNLNKSLWTVVMGYSPAGEMSAALSRTIQGIAGLASEDKLPPAAVKGIAQAIEKLALKQKAEPDTFLRDMFTGMRRAAAQADRIKYGALSVMKAVDQYAFEGGNYEVTEQDRKQAAEKAEQVSDTLTAEEQAALDTIEQALAQEVGVAEAPGREPAGERAGTESTADIDEDTINQDKASPFGALGPSDRNDQAIVDFFEKSPSTTAKAALSFLYGHLGKQEASASRDYSAKLVKMLQRVLPADLPIQMITADTKEADVIAHPATPALGWFASKGIEEAVYLIGPDFAQSALRTEVMLHEMTHAAVTYRLRTTAAKPYVAELESLLEAARAYVKTTGLTMFEDAVANVDELIAYGMTNRAFQRVLAEVKFKSNLSSKLGNALQALVSTLARLLGFADTDSANGLGALMSNVAALLEQQASEKNGAVVLSMAAEANTYSTMDILTGLNDGTVSATFQAHLREVLGSIVETLHGPFGSFKAALMKNQALSPMDVWLKALATGQAAFASNIMASGFKVSSQEAFAIEQIEATVRAALNASETRTKMAYRELADLYTEVYRNTKAQDFHEGDWSKATDAQKAKANELYEFVFKIEKGEGDRSDYLARFAGLGLAHQGFNRVLQRATERNSRKISDGQTFAERLQIVFENILEFFRSKMTRTYEGQNADVKLRNLVEQLVDIEAKNRFRLATEGAKSSMMEKLEAQGKALNDKLGQAAEKVLNSSWLRNNGNAFVRGAGAVARTVAGNRVDEFLGTIAKIRDEHLKERHGVLAAMVGEAIGPNEQAKFLLLGTKHNEKLRKDIIDAASNTSLSVFANGGEDLDDEAKTAISRAFLRSGAHTLVDHFSLAQIQGLLEDPAQLAAAVKQFENQLAGNARGYWMHQAKALGFYKATGKVTSQLMMTNAGNIARMLGTSYQGKISEEAALKAESALAPLVSLYALSYLSQDTMQAAAAVLKAENARTGEDAGNGVEFVLKLHKQLENESRDRLFEGSQELMIHGYTPEILNPYTEVQIADEQAGQELVDRGWSKGAQVPVDPADPVKQRRHVYVLRGAGMGARQTGIISWTNTAAKGTSKHTGYLNPANQSGLANAQLNASVLGARQDAIQRMFTAGASFDPTKVGTTYMAPVINPQGDIVNWRYLMQEDTKDQLMERDNRFEHILGSLAGSIFDKETSAEQNKKAMAALKEQYDAEYAKHADRYILVGPNSEDPDLRETWALLPDVTKRDVKSIWGREGVYVRKDSLDIVFGYRKLSAARMFKDSLDARQRRAEAGLPARVWDLDSEEFNMLEKTAIMSVETMLTVWGRTQGMNQQQAEAYSKRAATVITRGGRLWAEVVAETKDLIVVKSGTVLLGNIWSNLSLLVINGVPIKDIVHHHLVALKGATAYHADTEELKRLQLLLDSGHTLGKEAQIRRDIARLEDAIARNPITKLVDAGLMPTIVEDIASEDDIYSYKSALVRKADAVTSQLPAAVRDLGKTIYMTHDTPLYQGLSRVTQLSDFVARYTLFQHLTTRKIDPLSEKDAISRAVDSFIMYDVPMHPLLQYADDTGFFMFTKYFLRIQRVLRTMWMDNPARTMSALMLDNTLGLGPIVLDSAAALRIGNNPLESGAFKFFGSLDELATIKPLVSVFK